MQLFLSLLQESLFPLHCLFHSSTHWSLTNIFSFFRSSNNFLTVNPTCIKTCLSSFSTTFDSIDHSFLLKIISSWFQYQKLCFVWLSSYILVISDWSFEILFLLSLFPALTMLHHWYPSPKHFFWLESVSSKQKRNMWVAVGLMALAAFKIRFLTVVQWTPVFLISCIVTVYDKGYVLNTV